MDKKAFLSVLRFMKAKPWLILGMIGAMLLLKFGEQQLSDVLREVDLTYVDWGLGVIRLILQTALSAVLVFAWYKDKDKAAPFAAVDILKLFVTTFVTTVGVTLCMVTIVLIPLGVWLYLRIDFYMNTYVTGKSNGIFSCVGASFRTMRGRTGRYLWFNIKYLLFYFLVLFILFAVSFLISLPEELRTYVSVILPDLPTSERLSTTLDVIYAVFLSLFMPYRFLLKCGYYDEVLEG